MNSIHFIGFWSVLFGREAETAVYGFGETRICGSLETVESWRRVAHHFRVLPPLPPWCRFRRSIFIVAGFQRQVKNRIIDIKQPAALRVCERSDGVSSSRFCSLQLNFYEAKAPGRFCAGKLCRAKRECSQGPGSRRPKIQMKMKRKVTFFCVI